VVFPGRRWGGPGPDFRGALLALPDGTLVRGDVELHRRARDWITHRHAADPEYAQVVLHVVEVLDAPTFDAQQRAIPTLALRLHPAAPERLTTPPGQPRAGPWAAHPLAGPAPPSLQPLSPAPLSLAPCIRAAPAVLGAVEAAGRKRFRARAARFEGDLSVAPADQVLWRGLAEALGYTRNTEPFGRLAEAVPWPEAARVVVERGPVALVGLLLGTAGLIGSATLPEAHAWRVLQRQRGLRVAVGLSAWDRRAQRAANAPAQRCRGLAELAARWAGARGDGSGGTGARGAGARVAGALAEQALAAVRHAATVRRPRLWAFSWAGPWIGRGRAQVMAINVVLPFAAAAGVPEAAALFERLPGEPSNRVVRYMAEQLAAPGVRFRGACHQQGLLQLFKQTCAARICERCPARGQGAPEALEVWL
jgi:hypothetical protein